MSEKYSINWRFHLLLLAIFCCGASAQAQELLWSKPSRGARPHITMLQNDGKVELLMVGSPFSTEVTALAPEDGRQLWQTDLMDNVSRPGRLVADIAFIATHSGFLVALDSNDGSTLWRRQTERLNDFAASQPVFIEGSLYTLTHSGILSRFSIEGVRQQSRKVEHRVGDWIPRILPMWRDPGGLSYLDQSGRIRTFDSKELRFLEEHTVETSPGPGAGPDASEVVAGVYDAPRQLLWTTELSGALRATSLAENATLWKLPLGSAAHMWSESGRLLAVPILALGEYRRVLIVTRNKAWALDSRSGETQEVLELPAPAVAPPLYDAKRQTWWVVTQDSLLELHWSGRARVVKLPKMETPYTAALAGDLLVLGSERGRLYGLSLAGQE